MAGIFPVLLLVRIGMEKFKKVSRCRVCRGNNLVKYLNLGKMPLANNLVLEHEIPEEEKFPLEVLFCADCAFSQLSIVVNPDILFRNYVYRSSISNLFREHCRQIALELNGSVLQKGELVVDIASNDGCMLKEFKGQGNRILGVDPAINLAKIANSEGIETIPEYWAPRLADAIREKHGLAKVIISVNVFGHIDDLHSMVHGVKKLLSSDGYFIIESPHLLSLIEKTEFDTIYHEHLSYLLIKPLAGLMAEHGMRIAKVKKSTIHGGSVRIYIEHEEKPDTSDGSVAQIIAEEEHAGLHKLEKYLAFSQKVEEIRSELKSKLQTIKKQGNKICAFGASAKGNILLNYCGIGKECLDCIFDDTPEKQGKLYPGVHIPILPGTSLMKEMPDYLLLLAWNFADEIMQKTKEFKGAGGRYIIPIPKLRVI